MGGRATRGPYDPAMIAGYYYGIITASVRESVVGIDLNDNDEYDDVVDCEVILMRKNDLGVPEVAATLYSG